MAKEVILTKETLEQVFKLSTKKYSDETKSLILRVLLLTENATALLALKFLARIGKCNDEQVKYGIGKFFSGEHHLHGMRWQWAAGMITRENEFKTAQLKNKLPGLPRTR
jgi:hypothetical protein